MTVFINPDEFPDIDEHGGITDETILGSPRVKLNLLKNTKFNILKLKNFLFSSTRMRIHFSGNGTSTDFAFNHSFGENVDFEVYKVSNNERVFTGVVGRGSAMLTIKMEPAPAATDTFYIILRK